MDVKKIRWIDVLVFLYVFLLGFIKLGIPFYHYSFTVPDLILVIIFLYYALKKFNHFKIEPGLKQFIIFYILFFIGISLSLIGIKDLKMGLIELVAYVYGLMNILLFSLYISERGRDGLRVISLSCFIISLFIITGSFLIFTNLKIKSLLLYNEWNYIFFINMPNQLTIFLIICFNIYLISREEFQKIKFISPLLFTLWPLLFLIPVVLTGSRTGIVVGFCMALFGYYLQIKNIKFKWSSLYYLLILCAAVGLLFIMFHRSDLPNGLLRRATSVYENIIAGSITKGDVREENFKDGFHAFLSRPVNGVGLGNIWKNYSKWEIHNSFLSILGETGLCGFIPYLVLLGYMVSCFAKHPRRWEYIIVFLSVLGFSMQHHILRERWLWLFFTFLIGHAQRTRIQDGK